MWGAAKQSKVGEAAVALASVAARTAEQVGAAVSSISEASGAKAAAAFLSRIVTQTAARTSNAIGDSVRRRSDV
jgi:phage-related minor tail protein